MVAAMVVVLGEEGDEDEGERNHIRKQRDKLIRVGCHRSLSDLLERGVRLPEPNVVEHRAQQQRCVLADHGQL